MNQPSIQSFYRREPSSQAVAPVVAAPTEPGDGFSSSEIQSTMNPSGLQAWQPRAIYHDIDIGGLVPGPGRITFTGRIVNLGNFPSNKRGFGASGFFKLLIKDDTGIVAVSRVNHV